MKSTLLILLGAVIIFTLIFLPASQIRRTHDTGLNDQTTLSQSGKTNSNMPTRTTASVTYRDNVIPVVTPETAGDPDLNLEGTMVEIIVSAADGAIYGADGVTIEVPAGAVSEDAVLTLKTYTQSPPIASQVRESPLDEGISISPVYDLGPNGVQFDKPVTVTIPYDKSRLNDDVNPGRISMIYFNGTDWIMIGGQVDTDTGTVTASFTGFPGIGVAAVLTMNINPVVAGAAIAITVGAAVYHWYSNIPDPLAQGKASNYVVPNSPAVADYTSRAGLVIPGTTKGNQSTFVSMEDPNNPGHVNPVFITAQMANKRIGFRDSGSNTAPRSLEYPAHAEQDNNGNDLNWTPPDKFLTNGLRGECTCIANAYLSMFRRLGIPAYGVEGYKNNASIGQGTGRHAWIELVLDGQPYYYDDDEGLRPLQDIESILIRQGDIKGDGNMWNEAGQKLYVANWWQGLSTNTFTTQVYNSTGGFNTLTGTWELTSTDSQVYSIAPTHATLICRKGMPVHFVVTLRCEGADPSEKYTGISVRTYPEIKMSKVTQAGTGGTITLDFTLNTDADYEQIDVYWNYQRVWTEWDRPMPGQEDHAVGDMVDTNISYNFLFYTNAP
jgi:hypothetical protein